MYNEEKIEERICDIIEDERHFLLECSLYDDLRKSAMEDMDQNTFRKKCLELMLGKYSTAEIDKTIININRVLARRRRILQLKEE